MVDDARKLPDHVVKALALQMKQISPAMKAVQDLTNTPGIQSLMRTLAQQQEQTKRLVSSPAMQELLRTMDRHQEAMKRLLGPIEDLKRSGILAEMEKVRGISLALEAKFRMPALDELNRSIARYHDSPMFKALTQQTESARALSHAMESMHSPWIDRLEPLRSLDGFSSLQAIGQAIKAFPGFDERLSSLLRDQLGDWRDRITWPDNIFEDVVVRSQFYEQRGLNLALTEFPARAFAEGLELAELRTAPPTLVDLYGEPVPPADDEAEEDGLQRTNQAHEWLLRLETQIRQGIDTLMTAACGPDWPKHRMPNGMYDLWLDKQKKEVAAGKQPQPLIAYADFTDYAHIILRGDNWRQVFAPVFRREQDIRESLQRLYPIRLCTMHARIITQEDELLLYVEVKRIAKAVKQVI